MILQTFNPIWIILVGLFIIYFIISYYVVCATNLEKLFKQGHVVEIRTAYIIISFIISGLMLFVTKLIVDIVMSYIS